MIFEPDWLRKFSTQTIYIYIAWIKPDLRRHHLSEHKMSFAVRRYKYSKLRIMLNDMQIIFKELPSVGRSSRQSSVDGATSSSVFPKQRIFCKGEKYKKCSRTREKLTSCMQFRADKKNSWNCRTKKWQWVISNHVGWTYCQRSTLTRILLPNLDKVLSKKTTRYRSR